MLTIATFLANGTVRRWALGAIVTAIIAANARFGLGLSETAIGVIGAGWVATVLGSNYKAAQEAIADAHVAAGTSPLAPTAPVTPEAAAAAIAKLP